MIAALLAAAFTFTATATGVEKGTPLEFLFVGPDSDRDYEAMFVLDEPVDAFCRRLESAGLKPGEPASVRRCRLWPTGAQVKFAPAPEQFVETVFPDGVTARPFIYTGGTRDAKGTPEAATNMPLAVCSLYSIAQSPIVFDGIFEQGVVYGTQTAKKTLEKGHRTTFTLTWNEATRPLVRDVTFRPGNLAEILQGLKKDSATNDLDVLVRFADDLVVEEAVAAARALAVVDSLRIKINGRKAGDFFYQAFLPLPKWRDRRERLTQPFEINLTGDKPRVLFIAEDWTVEGLDPKLTPQEITFKDMMRYPQTDTAFLTVKKGAKVGDVKRYLAEMPKSVVNQYVFVE